MNIKPGKKAFTLIELLVVIAIIALLVSILMPSLQKAKEMARDVQCLSNLHHITTAIHMYLSDHDGVFPYNAWGGNGTPEGWTGWWTRVGIIPRDQVERVDTAQYPGLDRIYAGGYIEWRRNEFKEGIWKCPTANAQISPKNEYIGRWDNHYGMNGFLIGEMDRQPPWTVHCKKIEDFRSELHLVSDAHLGFNPSGARKFYFWNSLQLNPNWYAYDAWPLQLEAPNGTPNPFKGHTGGRANVARINGSVKAERELTWHDFMVRSW